MAGKDKSTRIVKKLRQNEERYRELFDSINVCVAVYKVKKDGEDFVFKDFNSAAEKVERVSRQDVIGKSILEVFPGVKESGLPEVMQRVWETEAPEQLQGKFYKDKKVRGWRDYYVYKLPSGDIVTVYEDITGRKKGQEALEDAELRYKTVADFTYNWEFWRGPDGKMLYVSPSCERISGYTPAQFIKDPRLMDKIVLPEDKAIHAAHVAREKERVEDSVVYRIKRKNGDIRWIEHLCRPIMDDNDKFLGTRGSNRDITERKLAEDKLSESEEKYRLVVENAYEGIVILQDGMVKFVNRNSSRVLGVEFENISTKPFIEFIHPDDRPIVLDRFARRLKGEKFEDSYPFRLVGTGGSLWVEGQMTSIQWHGKPASLIFLANLSARKEAEEALQKSEEQFRMLAENSADAIWTVDPDLNLTYISPAITQITGVSPEEASGVNIANSMTRDSMQRIADALDCYREDIARGVDRTVLLDIEHKRRGGGTVWVELSIRALYDKDGKHTGFIGVTHDISERKHAEEALRGSEEMFRLLAENTADAIWTLDTSLNLTYMSPAILKILGITNEEAYHYKIQDSMTPASMQKITETLERYRTQIERGTEKTVQIEIEHIRKDGAIVFAELSIRALYDKNGNHTGFIGVTRDITERKKAQETLQQSENKFSAAFMSAADPSVITEIETGKIIEANRAWETRLGYIRSEIINHTTTELNVWADPAQRDEIIGDLLRQGKIEDYEVRLRDRNGRIHDTVFSAEIIEINNKKYILSNAHDITELKEAADALRQSEEKYRLLAENSLDCIWTLDTNLKLTYISPSIERIRGIKPEEALGETIEQSMTPQSQHLIWKAMEKNREQYQGGTGGSVRIEIEHYHKDGGTVWVEMVLRALYGEDGRLTGFIGASRPIGERRKAQEDLRRSEEKYRMLAENTEDVIWTAGTDFRFTYMSPSILKLRGFTPEEAMAQDLEQTITPGSMPVLIQELERASADLEKGLDVSTVVEAEQYCRDGSTIWTESLIRPLYDKDRKHTGYIGTTRNITGRRQAEQRVKASEIKFSAAFMLSSDPAAITEVGTGKLVEANPAYMQWTGYTFEELVNASTLGLNLWQDPAQRREVIDIIERQGEVRDREVTVRTKSGQLRSALFSARIMDIEGRPHLFSRAHDITEQKEAAERLEYMNRRLTDLFEFLPDATVGIDKDHRVIFWNRAMEQMSGIPAAEMIGKGDYVYSVPFYGEARPALADLILDNMDEIEKLYPSISREGDIFVAEVFCPAVYGGKGIWAYGKASPLHDSDGNIIGALESIRDITAKKQAEEQIRKSEELYRLLAENADDCIWTMDMQFKPTYVSPAIMKMRGLTPQEAMNETQEEQNTPESVELVRREFRRLLQDVKNGIEDTYRLVAEQYHKNGSTVWVESTIRPYRDDSGDFAGFICISRNVTERVRAEKAIEQINRQMADVLNFLPDATLAVDRDKKVILWNQAIAKMTGIEDLDMLGKGDYIYSVPFYGTARPFLMDLLWEDRQDLRAKYPYIIEDGDSLISEAFCPTLYGGKGAWVYAKASPLHDRDGNMVGAIEAVRDITAEKKAEEAILQSETKYRLLAENAEDVIWTTDTDFIYTYVSPSITRLRGFKPDEIVGQPIVSTLTPETKKVLAEQWGMKGDSALEGKQMTWRGEILAPCKDGSAVWTEVLVKTMHDDSGKYTGFLGVSRDIRERKARDEALRESEEKYRLLAENTDDVIWLMDRDLHLTYVSPSVKKLRGVDPEEALQEKFDAMVTPKSREKILKLIERNISDLDAGKTQTIRQEIEQYRKDGSTVWVELNTKTLHDSTGRLTGFQGTARDISERKAAEQALRQSEERYRLVAENADDCIWRLDAGFNYTYISPSIRKLRGFEPEEAMRQTLRESTVPGSRPVVMKDVAEFAKEAALGKSRTSRVELEQYRKDGTTVWIESVCRSYLGADGRVAGYIGASRDISERRAAEKALRESQAKYQDLLENAGEAILIAQDGIVTFINSRLTELTGYSAEEFIGSPFVNYIHKEDVDWVARNYTARMRGEKINPNYSFRIVHKNGQTLWVEIHAALVTWEGKTAGLNFLTDITGSKKAEEALKKSEERFQMLADNMDDVIWTIGPELNFTYFSPSIHKLLGFSPEEMLLKTAEEIMPPETMKKVYREIENSRADIESGLDKSVIMEVEQYHKDGHIVPVEINVKTLYDHNRKLTGFLGTSRDITARMAAEKALIESEEKFRDIFEQSSDAVFIMDKEGHILDTNEALHTLTGYTRDEIRSLVDSTLKKERKRFLSRLEKDGSIKDFEWKLRRKDGTVREVLVTASVRTDSAGNILGYQGIMHDITERRRLEEERQKTTRLESIGTLAGGIAHDFNNILGAVIGNISMARTELASGHVAHDLLQDAEKAIIRARELTGQLLTFSKGGAPVKKVTLLTNMIVETAGFAVRGSNCRCRFTIAGDLSPADVDEGQMSQVINNLVINARQAMPSGGEIAVTAENILLSEELRLGKSLPLAPGRYIRISVRDQGIGIEPKHLGKVFDPYFTTKQQGSGLGLATCYSIIKNHGGHIGVESEPGQGATFYVYLAAAKGPAENIRQEEHREEVRLNGRILVMDDEAPLRTTIASMLKRLGFEHVVTAASGEEALDAYRDAWQSRQPFDAVILDLTVPGGMGGKETMEKLLKLDPDVTAIVSSGYATEPIMAEYPKYGFKGVIVKPYTFDELRNTMHKIMDGLKKK